jgi:hypothetical protein
MALEAFFSSFSISSMSTKLRLTCSAEQRFVSRKSGPQNGSEDVQISGQPLTSCPQNPNAVFRRPAAVLVELAKLAFVRGEYNSYWRGLFLCISDKFVEVHFGDYGRSCGRFTCFRDTSSSAF